MSPIAMQSGMTMEKNGKKSSGPMRKHQVKKTLLSMRMLNLPRRVIQYNEAHA